MKGLSLMDSFSQYCSSYNMREYVRSHLARMIRSCII